MTDQQRIAEIRAECNEMKADGAKGYMIHTAQVDFLLSRLAAKDAEIERLREAQRTLYAEFCNLLEASLWIPVSERLPEIDVAVIVRHIYQRDEYSPVTMGRLYQPCDKRRKPYWTFVSIRVSDGMVYNDGTDFICPGSEFVTHWQPIPAAPCGKDGEGE